MVLGLINEKILITTNYSLVWKFWIIFFITNNSSWYFDRKIENKLV